MNQELLNKLKCITDEELELLNGRKDIDNELYMEKECYIKDSRKLI